MSNLLAIWEYNGLQATLIFWTFSLTPSTDLEENQLTFPAILVVEVDTPCSVGGNG